MEYGVYTAASLGRVLHSLEHRYDLSSEDFVAAHAAHDEDRLAAIPHFTRHSWASFYAEWREFRRLSS